MKRAIDVCLGDERIGVLHHNIDGARESAAFAYDEAWRAAADAFPIDPTLPLVPGPQFHKKAGDGSLFHGIVADTEPDGWGRRVILRDRAKRRVKGRTSHLDYLLEVDDANRVGALRFRDETGVFQRAPEAGRRTAPPLIELSRLASASRAVEEGSETAEDLAFLRGRGTSLGGLRPKCSVMDDEERLCIGKFPSVSDERSVTKGEVLALRLARKAGIDAAEARLVDSDGVPVAVITRFDRHGDERLLYASARAMLAADPASDHAYTEIVDAIRVHGSAAQNDIEELWRRIAYSIAITNVDDHLLNHGFLHVAHGQWRLAPAFDINPFPDRLRELKTWISPEAGPDATVDALLSVAPYFRIAPRKAKSILAVVEGAVSKWREEGTSLGMTDRELDAFEDAFEHEQRSS